MNEWIIRVIEQGGYWGIALLMALENIFPPIPSELIMGAGGVAVARGHMRFWPLLLAGSLGSTLGNYCWFLAGDRFGYQRMFPLFARWGRWLTIDGEGLERAVRFFRRHGQWVAFAMRFSPFMRTMISLPAGLAHMRHWKFLGFTFAGTMVWNTVLIHGGRLAAPWLARMEGLFDAVVWGGVGFAFAWYLWRVLRYPRSRG